jgi:hypothetical protein
MWEVKKYGKKIFLVGGAKGELGGGGGVRGMGRRGPSEDSGIDLNMDFDNPSITRKIRVSLWLLLYTINWDERNGGFRDRYLEREKTETKVGPMKEIPSEIKHLASTPSIHSVHDTYIYMYITDRS